jgi:membrane protease YdiL (CAAX protease family)
MLTAAFIAVMTLIVVASLPVWVKVIGRWKSRQPLIEPASESPTCIPGVFALANVLLWLGSAVFAIQVFRLASGIEELDPEQLTPFQLSGMMSVTALCQLVFLAVGTTLVLSITNGHAKLGWRFDRWSIDSRIAIACFLIATPIVLAVQTVLSLIMPYEHPAMQAIVESGSLLPILAVAFSAIIGAGIGEEIVFRGFIQNWLQQYSSGWMPIVVTSALFSLAHWGHGLGPITLFGFSLLLGYVFRQTGSLLPCIALHMLNNGFSVFWLAMNTLFGQPDMVS